MSATAVVGNLGALYRLLKVEGADLPASLAVRISEDDLAVQVHGRTADGGRDDIEAVAQVWTLARLLDELELVRATITASRVCHYSVIGRLGGVQVEVVTVLAPPAAAAVPVAV